MEVAQELFVIPNGENFILYAPLEGSVMEVTSGVVGFLQQVQAGTDPVKLNPELATRLQASRILVEKSKDPKSLETRAEFKPTSVTLLPTYDCNLQCHYCYATAGEVVA